MQLFTDLRNLSRNKLAKDVHQVGRNKEKIKKAQKSILKTKYQKRIPTRVLFLTINQNKNTKILYRVLWNKKKMTQTKQYWTNSDRKMQNSRSQKRKNAILLTTQINASLLMTQMSKAISSIKWPINLVAVVIKEVLVIKKVNLIKALIQTNTKETLKKVVKFQLNSLLKIIMVVFTLKAYHKIQKLRFKKVQIILNHQVDLPLIH